jgi:hypothetical protein
MLTVQGSGDVGDELDAGSLAASKSFVARSRRFGGRHALWLLLT